MLNRVIMSELYGHWSIMKMATSDELLSLLRRRKKNRRENHGRPSCCVAPAAVRGGDWHWEHTSVFGKAGLRLAGTPGCTRSFWASFYQSTQNDLSNSVSSDAPEALHHSHPGVFCAGRCGIRGVPNPNSWSVWSVCEYVSRGLASTWKSPSNVVEENTANILCNSQFHTGRER